MVKICVLWDNPYDQRKSIFLEASKKLKRQYGIPYTFADITKGWEKFERLRKKFQATRLPAVIFYDDNRAIVLERPSFEDKKEKGEILHFLIDAVMVIEDEDLLKVKVKDYMAKDRIVNFLGLDDSKRVFVKGVNTKHYEEVP